MLSRNIKFYVTSSNPTLSETKINGSDQDSNQDSCCE